MNAMTGSHEATAARIARERAAVVCLGQIEDAYTRAGDLETASSVSENRARRERDLADFEASVAPIAIPRVPA